MCNASQTTHDINAFELCFAQVVLDKQKPSMRESETSACRQTEDVSIINMLLTDIWLDLHSGGLVNINELRQVGGLILTCSIQNEAFEGQSSCQPNPYKLSYWQL